MLTKLHKIDLDMDKAVVYVQEQLNCSHVLSQELFRTVDLRRGNFFTFLPANADLNRLYDFYGGYILPQNKMHEYVNESGYRGSYTWIPTLNDAMSEFVLNELNSKPELMWVFEEVILTTKDKNLDLYHQIGCNYDDEIYYLVHKTNASKEVVDKAINYSDALWHHVFISTSNVVSSPNKALSKDDISNFCKNIELLVVGAYDGEGFVLWESNYE